MILGKENSSGYWCYLCKLLGKEFSELYKMGDPLTYNFMNECVKKAKRAGKAVSNAKEEAWWQFFLLKNILVPLLHKMIGIGNDILGNFKEMVNRYIEKLNQKEVLTRHKLVACEEGIDKGVAKRVEFDALADGKELKRLEDIAY